MAVLTYLTTTHFDFGAVKLLPTELERLGVKRPLLCTDKGLVCTGLAGRVVELLGGPARVSIFDGTPGNPTEVAVLAALEQLRAERSDGVVALGGGSSIDLAKAVALLATHAAPLAQYDPDMGGRGRVGPVLPLIAMPTTSGTGSEVSVGTVIVMNDGRKRTFISPNLVPRVAICDPELTLGLPPRLTAATGMDAITHCIEAVLSPVVNPPAEGIGLDGLERGFAHIERAVADGQDREARWQMMMASTEGAMAFVKGLGAVHSMSHAIGRLKELNAHHGTLNAVILPTVLRFNVDACGDKYARLRRAMHLSADADLAHVIEQLNARLGLPANLREMGVSCDMIPGLVEQAMVDLAALSNPRKASAQDYTQLFRDAIG